MNRYTLFFVLLTYITLHAVDPRLTQDQPQPTTQFSQEQLKAIYPTEQEVQAAHKEFPFVIECLDQDYEKLQNARKELLKEYRPLIQEYTALQIHKQQVKQLKQENDGLRALADNNLQEQFTLSAKHHSDLVNTYLPLVVVAGVLGSRAIASDCFEFQNSTILQAAGTMLFDEYIKKHPDLAQYSLNMSAFGLTGQISLADTLKGIFLNVQDDKQLQTAKTFANVLMNIINYNIQRDTLDDHSKESQEYIATMNDAYFQGKTYLLECARIVATHHIKQSIALNQTTSRKLPGTDITLFHDAQLVDPIIAQGLDLVAEYVKGNSVSKPHNCIKNVATDISNELIYNAAVQLLHAVDQKTGSNDGLIECLISKDCQTHSSSQRLAKIVFNSLPQTGKIQVLTTSTALAARAVTNQIEQPIARIAANVAVDTTTQLAHTYITEYIASSAIPDTKQASIASLKKFCKNAFIEGTYTAACPLAHKLVNDFGQNIGIKEEHVEIFFPKDKRPKTVTHMITALLCKYGTNLALFSVRQRIIALQNHYTQEADRLQNAAQLLDVKVDASNEEIKSAHRGKIKIHHPDKNLVSDANEKSQEINVARDLLVSRNSLVNQGGNYKFIKFIHNIINYID